MLIKYIICCPRVSLKELEIPIEIVKSEVNKGSPSHETYAKTSFLAKTSFATFFSQFKNCWSLRGVRLLLAFGSYWILAKIWFFENQLEKSWSLLSFRLFLELPAAIAVKEYQRFCVVSILSPSPENFGRCLIGQQSFAYISISYATTYATNVMLVLYVFQKVCFDSWIISEVRTRSGRRVPSTQLQFSSSLSHLLLNATNLSQNAPLKYARHNFYKQTSNVKQHQSICSRKLLLPSSLVLTQSALV